MATLMSASNNWANRPDDERFTNLHDLHAATLESKEQSKGVVVANRKITVEPVEGDRNGMVITGPNGHAYEPTHWSFGQLANRAGGPAGYLRTLPTPIAADAINWGLRFNRDVEDVGVLLQRNGRNIMRAVTGPTYGRIWNADITAKVIKMFGDGVSGDFRVPGIFGKPLEQVTKADTTLYASDRDMFIFLADEENRIEMPGRRNGESGSLARGFFIQNSEEGAASLRVTFFLFDYVCCNRIVWGATDVKEIAIRHSSGAPDRYLEDVVPAIEAYVNRGTGDVVELITAAQQARLEDEADKFLANRFGKQLVEPIKLAHVADEGRPIETIWDAVTGATAYARGLGHQDARVAIERQAGGALRSAA